MKFIYTYRKGLPEPLSPVAAAAAAGAPAELVEERRGERGERAADAVHGNRKKNVFAYSWSSSSKCL